MRLNIKFLETGGVPLTNDLMNMLQEAYSIYDVLGDIAGHLTILSGCNVTGQNVSPGIVVINGNVLYFEGGLITSTVYINTEVIKKTFQSQEYKALIEIKTVKFGLSTPDNQWNWQDFVKLETLKSIQDKVNNTVSRQEFDTAKADIALLKQKTAPIVNGGIVWAWFKPVNEIPEGWKEAKSIRGKTIVGLDPDDPELSNLKSVLGEKAHKLLVSEMAEHVHRMFGGGGINTPALVDQPSWTAAAVGDSPNDNSDWNYKVTTAPGDAYAGTSSKVGGNQPHNNMQPSIIANFIEPNFI